MRYIYLFIPVFLLLWSCEDVVDVQYNIPAGTIYNIDAFVNDGLDTQTISIVESPNFLDDSSPIPVTNALVILQDSTGNDVVFQHESNGTYIWIPNGTGLQLSTTVPATLDITIGNNRYTAESLAGNVPIIDSLTFMEDDFAFAEEGAVNADFWATDIANEDNYYWAKMSVNGEYLEETYGAQKLAYNGAYDQSSDGIQFIPPIRTFDLEAATGDMVSIELWGIDSLTSFFLNESFELLNNTGQFAVPYYNPRCNLIPTQENSNDVIGWFGTAKLATMSREYDLE